MTASGNGAVPGSSLDGSGTLTFISQQLCNALHTRCAVHGMSM